jgi:two-component system alkaline phosphatase synthesis response regulator PhoP
VWSVLIVDDDAMFREVVRMRLSAAGYRTVVASSADEGWVVVQAERPDVVLLDLIMPEADGVTFLRRLRADPSLASTPVIVVSALSFMALTRAAEQLGIQHQLIKSRFSLSELVERVTALLPDRPVSQTA